MKIRKSRVYTQVLEKGQKYHMEPKNEQSKRDIAKALISLMREEDYAKITNKDITDRAKLSHITYYRNFKSKDEIIQYYLYDITDSFIERTKVNYDMLPFHDYLVILFTHLYEQRELGELLLSVGFIHYVKDEFDRIFSAKAKSHNELYSRYFVAGGLYNLYYVWLKNGCKESPEELADLFMDFRVGNA